MSFHAQDPDEVMNEINMTPLVDVMLVLLVIFILTVPVLQQSLPIELPRTTGGGQTPSPTLRLSVDANGGIVLNGQPLAASELAATLNRQAQLRPPPALHISGDRRVPYEHMARVLATAQQAGLTQVGLVTERELP